MHVSQPFGAEGIRGERLPAEVAMEAASRSQEPRNLEMGLGCAVWAAAFPTLSGFAAFEF